MGRKAVEVALLLVATALITWGLARAAARGEPAATSWTTYLQASMLLLAYVNVPARRRPLAIAIIVVSFLLGMTVLAASGLAAAAGSPFASPAILRAFVFLACLAIVGFLQAGKAS